MPAIIAWKSLHQPLPVEDALVATPRDLGGPNALAMGLGFADLSQIPNTGNNAAGYEGMWSDGIYLYLVPTDNGGSLGHTFPPVARYDTRQSFRDYTNGWSLYQLPNSPASTGAAWDGQFAYLGPYGAGSSGVVTRIRTFTPGPTDILGAPFEGLDLFKDSSGNFGLGTNQPAYGLHQLGGSQRLQAIATPSQPLLALVGGGGTTTYGYYIVAVDRSGNRTLAGPQQTIANCPSPSGLSQTNYIGITWTAVAGAAAYDVVRSQPGSPLLVGTVTIPSARDVGGTLQSYAPPAANATANATVDGLVITSGLQLGIGSQTANYTMLPTDSVIFANAQSGTFTVTLPPAAYSGKVALVIRTDGTGGNTVSVAAGSGDSISGGSVSLNGQGNAVTFVCNGVHTWYPVATH
jgi:hypothetical protein